MNVNIEELFLYGVKCGDIEDIANLIGHVNINCLNEDTRDFPLIIAVRRGDLAIVKMLVENGADLKMTDKFGYSAILSAAWTGKVDIVDYLLDCGENINQQDSRGNTLLMLATLNADEAAVRYLLNKDADINLTDTNDWTALMKAIWNGRPHIVNLLLKAGANKQTKNNENKDALSIAYQYDQNMRKNGIDTINSVKTIDLLNGFDEYIALNKLVSNVEDYTEAGVAF